MKYYVNTINITVDSCLFGIVGMGLSSMIYLSLFKEASSLLLCILFFFWVLTAVLIAVYRNKYRMLYIMITESSFIAQYKTKQIELFYEDIEGYEVLKNYILIKSKNKGKESIAINNPLENQEDFLKFLGRNYDSLEYLEATKINEDFFSDDFHGKTFEERELKKISQINKLNLFQILLTVVYPFGLLTDIVLLFYPLLIFWAFYYFKYVSRCIDIFESFWFTVYIFCALSLITLIIKNTGFIVIEGSSNLIFYYILSTLIISLFSIYLKRKKGIFFGYLLTSYVILYGWLSIYRINISDKNNPVKSLSLKINDKYKQQSKGGFSHHLDGILMGNKEETISLSVSQEKYDTLQVGQIIKIPFFRGILNVHYTLDSY